MIGQRLLHYEIVGKLGEGGMGVVYKARDTHLNRFVALKLLSPGSTSDPTRVKRFMREAQAASSLNHPNIVTIYEVGTAPAASYIAMEYVEGSTLQAIISGERMTVPEAVDLALQIAGALDAAHRHGIIHRDLKPANIMLSADRLVKVLDFGLAKLSQPSHAGETAATRSLATREGVVLGTAAYMSPEQARGENVDHRSDIFSFGALLYEMLGGQPAFQRPSQVATLAAVLRDEPPPLRVLVPEASPGLDEVVKRCLRKDAGERFQSSAELKSALRLACDHSDQASAGRKAGLPAIAVLAFADMSPARDQEYFCDGIAEEILNGLAKIQGLHVASRTSAFRYKGQATDICDIGRQLKVSAVLEGSVRKSGNRLRITAQLINVTDGFHLWSEQYDRALEDVFAIQDEISAAIVGALKVALQPQAEDVPRRRARNAAAYNHYLKGRYCWNRRSPDSLKAAVEHFQEALAEDPGYSAAYAGLADSFVMLGMQGYLSPRESMPRALAAARRALELDASLAEAHVSLASGLAIYEWDWKGALAHLEQAMQLNAEYATAYHWYGLFFCMARGREDDGIRAMRRAQDLDPLSLPIGADFGLALLLVRRHQDALEQCRRVLDLDATFFRPYWYLGRVHTQLARWDDAFQALGKARELSQWDPRVEAALGFAYARSGQHAEAARIIEWLKTTSGSRYVHPCETAIIAAGLGDTEMAFAWLDRALLERGGTQMWLRIDPYFDSLRGDPRYFQFLNRMGLDGT